MTTISYYFSVLSPFTYLAGDRLEQVARRHDAGVEYIPMDILELFTRTGGVAPKNRHASRQKYRIQEIVRIAKRTGMPVNLVPKYWPTDPRPASYAIINAVDETGDMGLLVRNFLTACWAEDADIARAEVVRQCLAKAGYSPEIAERDSAGAQATFEANTQKAVDANVFGSPAYVVGEEVFWGQDRLDYLNDYLAELK